MPCLQAVNMMRNGLLVGLTLLCVSCSSGPPPKLYLLEPVHDLALEQTAPNVQALGLAISTLPGYAKDQRLASRDSGSMVVQSDKHRWAEAPEDAITRVLANRLREFTEATVLIEPWPRGFAPQARIEIAFDRLLREASGGAELEGQIRLIAGDGRKVLAVRTFQLVHFSVSADPANYFAAVSAGINDIARMSVSVLNDFY